MDDNKVIAIIFGLFIVFGLGGMMVNHTMRDVEQEKTKQLEIQWKIDSLKSTKITIQ